MSAAPSTLDLAHTALPKGTTLHQFRFTKAEGQEVYLVLDSSDGRSAVACGEQELNSLSGLLDLAPETNSWSLVSVPSELESQADLAAQIREALMAREDQSERTVTLISLQGVHLIHAPGWIVVCGPENRLEAAGKAALEAFYHEAELRDLEAMLSDGWGELQEAAPMAFEANGAGFEKRAAIQARFLELVEWRGRHSRLGPKLMVPQVYPPTLTSQIGERVRDRMKMIERWELSDGHLESYEEIYHMCGERLSEFGNARRGHFLEWLIIAILAFQSVLWIVESLANASAT